jgi:hypothetical protein
MTRETMSREFQNVAESGGGSEGDSLSEEWHVALCTCAEFGGESFVDTNVLGRLAAWYLVNASLTCLTNHSHRAYQRGTGS